MILIQKKLVFTNACIQLLLSNTVLCMSSICVFLTIFDNDLTIVCVLLFIVIISWRQFKRVSGINDFKLLLSSLIFLILEQVRKFILIITLVFQNLRRTDDLFELSLIMSKRFYRFRVWIKLFQIIVWKLFASLWRISSINTSWTDIFAHEHWITLKIVIAWRLT